MANEKDPTEKTPALGRVSREVEEAGLAADMGNPEPDSLFRGPANKWDKRSQQTGMEKKHEAWILDTINFLGSLEIPVWKTDAHGNRVKGGTYEIPHRLNLAKQKFIEYQNRAYDAAKLTRERGAELEENRRIMKLLREALTPEEGDPRPGEAIALLENHLAPKLGPNDPSQLPVDDRGVGTLRMDVRDVMIRLGLNSLTHDFAPGERRCGGCWGLGLIKAESNYAVGDRKPGEAHFPYKHQWLRDCPVCYMGKESYCLLEGCGKTIPRNRTRCDCKEADDARRAAAAEKEAARRKTVQRVKLSDYGPVMLWADQGDKFVMVDDIDDHLEEFPEEIFFGCRPVRSDIESYADQFMEMVRESSWEEMRPEDDDDVVEFREGAAEKLKALLGVWGEHYADFKELFYQDADLIVEVPRA